MRIQKFNLSFQIIISLFSINCDQLPKQIPNDFQLQIESSSVQPGASGNYSLMIKRTTGEDQFELIRNYDNTIHKLTLSNYDAQRLYDDVHHAKIFNLKNTYADMNVLDGSNIILTVHADRKTKVINMRNKQPEELKNVFSILSEFELAIR